MRAPSVSRSAEERTLTGSAAAGADGARQVEASAAMAMPLARAETGILGHPELVVEEPCRATLQEDCGRRKDCRAGKTRQPLAQVRHEIRRLDAGIAGCDEEKARLIVHRLDRNRKNLAVRPSHLRRAAGAQSVGVEHDRVREAGSGCDEEARGKEALGQRALFAEPHLEKELLAAENDRLALSVEARGEENQLVRRSIVASATGEQGVVRAAGRCTIERRPPKGDRGRVEGPERHAG